MNDARLAASKTVPNDPLSALKHIYARGSGDDVALSGGAAGNLTAHAKELREASSNAMAAPEDANLLSSIASKLEQMGTQETQQKENGEKGEKGEGESSASGPEKAPETEQEQLVLIAKRLANAIHGPDFGVTSQQQDQIEDSASGAGGAGGDGVSEGASESSASGGASGPSQEDLQALRTVAVKLGQLLHPPGSSGPSSPVEPLDDLTLAMQALASAVSGPAGKGGEGAALGEDDVKVEELDDDQLSGRIDTLQKELDELHAASSGASGGAGEGEGSESDEDSVEAQLPPGADVEVPADGADGSDGGDGGDGGDKQEAGKEEENAAKPDTPKPGDKVEPVKEGEEDGDDFKKATMVDRNTIAQHLEAQENNAGVAGSETTNPGETSDVRTPEQIAPPEEKTPNASESESPEIVGQLKSKVVPNGGGDYQVTAQTR